MSDCLGKFMSNYRIQVETKDDATILDDIRRASLHQSSPKAWFYPKLSTHRLYLRLLLQEAHRRGIS